MKNLTLLFISLITTASFTYAQINFHSANNNLFIADIDNDGFIDDIGAFASENGQPELLLWQSNNVSYQSITPQIELPETIKTLEQIQGNVSAGDFDNDGFVDDLVMIHEVGHNKTDVTVWINKDGKYLPETWWHGSDFDANQIKNTILVGDFDNDGFSDDIAAFYDYEQTHTKVFVWKSNGSQFNWPGTWWVGNDFNATNVQKSCVVGDFDHDGFNDDIATLYNYDNDYCKIFVWTTNKQSFNWPYTWYKKDNFTVSNALGNIISGDFNNNGFNDNIAALYRDTEDMSHILVWERDKKGFSAPQNWWYGDNEGQLVADRLIATDFNGNGVKNQVSGIQLNETSAEIITWTAENKTFYLPTSSWAGVTAIEENCELNGGCLPDELQEQFNIYPNPSIGDFSLDIPNITQEPITITIYDVIGAQVHQRIVSAGEHVNYALDELMPGNYMVHMECESFYYHQKLIVQ